MLRRAEALGELGGGQILPVSGAEGVEIREERIKACLVAQNKNNVELHDVRGGQTVHQLCLSIGTHVACHESLSVAENNPCDEKRGDEKQDANSSIHCFSSHFM